MSAEHAHSTPADEPGFFERAEKTGQRLSFTITMVAMVALAGWLTRTEAGHSLSARTVQRLGFAPADTASFDVLRAVGSAFVTNSPFALWTALASIAVLVGATEWRHGSLRTALAFWGSHLVTIGLSWVLLVPFNLAARSAGSVIFLARDVGPSAGYVGCLGYVLAGLRPPWRAWTGGAVLLGLLGALGWSIVGAASEPVEVSAALSHAIALVVGFSAGVLTERRRRVRAERRP